MKKGPAFAGPLLPVSTDTGMWAPIHRASCEAWDGDSRQQPLLGGHLLRLAKISIYC
jgi:hypothetical protein